MTSFLSSSEHGARMPVTLRPVFKLLPLIWALMVPGCTDPNAPEYLNPHDAKSTAYVPSAPTSVGLSGITEHSRLLTWKRISLAETGFSITRRAGLTGPFDVIGSALPGAESFLDTTGIRTDVPYMYRVFARGATGITSTSDSIGFTLTFPAPQNFRVSSGTHDAVGLSWSDPGTFAEGYVFELRTLRTAFTRAATFPAHTLSATIPNLDTTQDYAFRIQGFTALNTGRMSNTAGVVFAPVVEPMNIVATIGDGSSGRIERVFSHDGSRLLTYQVNHVYEVYDVVRGRYMWGRDVRDMTAAGFSGDNDVFVFSTTDGSLHVVRLSTGLEVKTVAGSAEFSWPGQITVNHDGSVVAYGQQEQLVICDVASGAQLLRTTAHSGTINSLDFSPDGSLLACGTGVNLELWSIPQGQRVWSDAGTGGQYYVSFGPRNRLVAIGLGGHITFWDMSTRVRISTVEPVLFGGPQGGFDAEGERFVAEYQPDPSSQLKIGIWRVSDGLFLSSIPLAAGEMIGLWTGFESWRTGAEAIQIIDFESNIRVRRFANAWQARDW